MAKFKNLQERKRQFGMCGGKYSRRFRFYQQKFLKARKVQADYMASATSHFKSELIGPLKLKFKKTDFNPLQCPQSKYSVHTTECPTKLKIKKDVYTTCTSTISSGYRLMDTTILSNYIKTVTTHVATCKEARIRTSNGLSPFSDLSESVNYGLASLFTMTCQGCFQQFKFKSSTKIKISDEVQRYDINVRGVWGSMATGGGSAHLKELMATLNAPGLSQKSFTKIENEISKWWQSLMEEDMLAAGREERDLAIQRGDYHQGVPAITVVCDGGWSKRTHKHSYNALGGVGVIIGAVTGKILHIGVRNKYCYVCAAAGNKNIQPKEHICFKNWSESSQSMEADIMVDGFSQAESRHCVRYMRLIADGDSSVFARIQETVPIWGGYVQKLECANHVCKCLRSSLEKLVEERPQFKGKGRLTEQVRSRLTTAVRCAIRMRSLETDRATAIRLLRHDILNSIHHIFGDHRNCTNFCKVRYPDAPNVSIIVNDSPPTSVPLKSINHSDGDVIDATLMKSVSFWKDASSLGDEDASRQQTNIPMEPLTKDILQSTSKLLARVAEKADRLFGNFTTNLAESWMSLRTKFDGGKQFNRCASGSWLARCFGVGLRRNFGVDWSPKVWEEVTSTKAGSNFCSLYRSRLQKANCNKVRSVRLDVKRRRRARKQKANKEASSKSAKFAYGRDAVDVVPDLNTDQLEQRVNDFYLSEIQLPQSDILTIEQCTKDQCMSNIWFNERKKRLTSSNFGSIVARRPALPVRPLVERLLYSSFSGNSATRFGLREERSAKEEFVRLRLSEGKNITVEDMGLCIDQDHPYLAASTDGMVTEDGVKGLLEIKHVLFNKSMSLKDAAGGKSPNFCLKLIDGQLQLKRSHSFFMQCQGQLNIFKLPWLDFLVRRIHPYELHVERIERDQEMWSQHIRPKLRAFYFKAVLPELACPRHGKSPGIREPGVWFQHQAEKKGKAKSKSSVAKVVKEKEKTNPTLPTVQPSTSGHIATPVKVSQSSKLVDRDESNLCTSGRTRRVKFVGRRIQHKWTISDGVDVWYSGTVIDVVTGKDGGEDTVYEVYYEEDEEKYEIDGLQEDLIDGSVYFDDI